MKKKIWGKSPLSPVQNQPVCYTERTRKATYFSSPRLLGAVLAVSIQGRVARATAAAAAASASTLGAPIAACKDQKR